MHCPFRVLLVCPPWKCYCSAGNVCKRTNFVKILLLLDTKKNHELHTFPVIAWGFTGGETNMVKLFRVKKSLEQVISIAFSVFYDNDGSISTILEATTLPYFIIRWRSHQNKRKCFFFSFHQIVQTHNTKKQWRIQLGAVKLVLWHHWMLVTQVHQVTSEKPIHCTKLYAVHIFYAFYRRTQSPTKHWCKTNAHCASFLNSKASSARHRRVSRWGTVVCESGNERHTGPADSHVCDAALHALAHCPSPVHWMNAHRGRSTVALLRTTVWTPSCSSCTGLCSALFPFFPPQWR